MAQDLNVFNATGRLGRDAKLINTKNGKTLLSFSIAVNIWNGTEEDTLWVSCSLFGDRGTKLEQYLVKGQQVAITGPISLNTYEKDGETFTNVQVLVNNLVLIGGRSEGGEGGAPAAKKPTTKKQAAPAKDDFDFGDDEPDDSPF